MKEKVTRLRVRQKGNKNRKNENQRQCKWVIKREDRHGKMTGRERKRLTIVWKKVRERERERENQNFKD